MMHPDTELRFISPEVGHGVFATRFIPKGTITWTGDPLDQRISPETLASLPPLCQEAVLKYAYVDPQAFFVLCWDHGRFVNHSCDPNCLSAGYQFEFAVRDIAEGEQLTDDYGLMNLTAPMECRCGSPACRRQIGVAEFELHTARWDALVEPAFRFLDKVPQPLWPLVAERREIAEALATGAIASCKMHAVSAD